jgi:hypothetical protein
MEHNNITTNASKEYKLQYQRELYLKKKLEKADQQVNEAKQLKKELLKQIKVNNKIKKTTAKRANMSKEDLSMYKKVLQLIHKLKNKLKTEQPYYEQRLTQMKYDNYLTIKSEILNNNK